MQANPNRNGLIAKIHVAKKQLALADENYRAFLMGATGKDSCSAMSVPELEFVLQCFKKLGFENRRPRRAGKRPMAAGDQARKIRALWLMLYHLGAVDEPSEEALAAFAKRVSGAEALQWATPQAADKIIKALRGWLDRIGYYYPKAEDYRFYPEPGQAENISLIRRQAEILGITDMSSWLNDNGFGAGVYLRNLATDDLLQIMEILGKSIRRREGRG